MGTDGNAEVVNLDLESLNKVYTNVRSVRITGDGVARLSLREIQIFQSANFSVPANQTWLGARAWYKSDTGIASDMDGRVRKWFDVTANKINMTTNNNNQ